MSLQVRHRPLTVLARQRKRRELEAALQRALIEVRITADSEAKDTVRVTLEQLAQLYAVPVSNRGAP